MSTEEEGFLNAIAWARNETQLRRPDHVLYILNTVM